VARLKNCRAQLKSGDGCAPTACFTCFIASRGEGDAGRHRGAALFSIDRSTSGELGLAVVYAFLGSKMEADDRWSCFSALVGDDGSCRFSQADS